MVEKITIASQTTNKIMLSLIILFLTEIFIIVTIKIANKKIINIKKRHSLRKRIYYISFLMVIILMLFIWVQNIGSVTTFLGMISAGLALALHQALLNIAGWVLIVLQHPFNLGDRIEWDGIKGDVIDINIFYTSLLETENWVNGDQSTGRVVNIPNANIFKIPQFNYSTGFSAIWDELKILYTFKSDWEKAKKIMTETVYEEKEKDLEKKIRKEMKDMGKTYMIKQGKLTPITYVDIKESGIQITIRYLSPIRHQRGIRNRIFESMLKKLRKEENIEMAYPTITLNKE